MAKKKNRTQEVPDVAADETISQVPADELGAAGTAEAQGQGGGEACGDDPSAAAGCAGQGDAGAAAAEAAVGEGDGEPPPLDEHKADPVVSDLVTVEDCEAAVKAAWFSIRMEEGLAADDRERHSTAIKGFKAEIDRAYAREEEIELQDCDEVIDDARGIVSYVSRKTGRIVKTRPILPPDKQLAIPATDGIGNSPIVVPVKPTFADLQPGKVWEHDEFGIVRIDAVFPDSVHFTTSGLDDIQPTIASQEAWDRSSAYPREVPDLATSQRWSLDGCACVIEALDDVAANVKFDNDGPARVSRLAFCASSAKQIKVPEIGTRVWLDDKGGPVVVVQGEEVDGHVLCRHEDSGNDEQIEIARLLAGDVLMPEKKKGKGRKGTQAAAEA